MPSAIGYKRVSNYGQNEVRQLDGMTFDKVFIDKASGKDTQRPQLQAMLEYVCDGDTVTIRSLDRLGRNLLDLQVLVGQLKEKGFCQVKFLHRWLGEGDLLSGCQEGNLGPGLKGPSPVVASGFGIHGCSSVLVKVADSSVQVKELPCFPHTLEAVLTSFLISCRSM